jgi:hypothetical protein
MHGLPLEPDCVAFGTAMWRPCPGWSNEMYTADQAAGSQMFQPNLILPEPVQFLTKNLPPVSIVHPTLTRNGGAMATIQAFIADNLFLGQKDQRFFQAVLGLATAADQATRDLNS